MLVTGRTRAARSLRAIVSLVPFCTMVAPTARAGDDAKRACVAASTDAQTLRHEDKLLAARDELHVCASDPCPEVVKSRCTHWLTEVEAQIPSVIVRAKDAAGGDVLDADVSIDGHASRLGRPETLDPGEHVVLVKRAGGDSKEERFLLVDGERARVLTVNLFHAAPAVVPVAPTPTPAVAPAQADAHAGRIPLGTWVLGGLGLVAFAGSAIFYAEAANDYGKLSTCSPNCSDAQTQSVRTNEVGSGVALGVGIAAVVGAVTWALLSPSAKGTKPLAYAPIVEVRPTTGGALTTIGVRY
jgi:hypothetical protein